MSPLWFRQETSSPQIGQHNHWLVGQPLQVLPHIIEALRDFKVLGKVVTTCPTHAHKLVPLGITSCIGYTLMPAKQEQVVCGSQAPRTYDQLYGTLSGWNQSLAR